MLNRKAFTVRSVIGYSSLEKYEFYVGNESTHTDFKVLEFELQISRNEPIFVILWAFVSYITAVFIAETLLFI